MKTDFLIVGQGIAGTCLAHTLQQRGAEVMVLDLPTENTSSVVATGICNPITGKHLSLTWEAEAIFNILAPFYQSMEALLHKTFFFPLPFYRRFPHIEAQNQHAVRLDDTTLARFVQAVPTDTYKQWIDSPLGGWQTNFSGYVRVGELLETFRHHLIQHNAFREIRFEHSVLKVHTHHIQYQDIEARQIVFCEGGQASQNPYFPAIPFAPNKGEWIKIRLNEAETCPAILKQGVFFLPLGDGIYQVGATYQQQPLDTLPTHAGKQELLTQLQEWLKVPFEVIAQGAGIRPATRTRRPVMGLHETYKNMGILNGLGSKGVSLAPLLATQLADLLIP